MIKPEVSQPVLSAAARRAAETRDVTARYRRAQVYGLLLIAGVILAVVVYRAAPHMLFPPGWWH